jgi:Calx-beta domain-containing protein/carboxypeptidase family protein/beta-propeller repeat-containing protein
MISFTPLSSRINRAALIITICLVTAFASVVFVTAENDNLSAVPAQAPNDAATKARIAERFGKLQLSFEINHGQTDERVKFLSHGSGYDLFLTATDAVLALRKPHDGPIDKFKRPTTSNAKPDPEVTEGAVLRLRMIGANSNAGVEGQDELPGKINYFIGNDPEKWRRNIPTYRKVHYESVYPGIDMVYYGNQRELEYDFVVAAGANPTAIKFRVEGADKIHLDKSGNLLFALKQDEIQLKKPSLYQLTAEGERREVKGEYVIDGNEVGIKVHAFDSNKPLVIDPVLSYSTFLGAGSSEWAYGIAVDSQGSAYVTGTTNSSGFPTTPGAFKTNTTGFGGAFVTKLDPTGSFLVYSTYISGTNSSATGTAIAIDSAGNAHVTGYTSGTDFPTVNALKTSANLFKTTNSAATWSNNNTGLDGDVPTLAIAPNAPNTLYAGSLGGVFRSADGGATWVKPAGTGLPAFPFTTALAVDPTNASVVYVGFITGGFYKSSNAGETFTPVNIPLSVGAAFSIAFDPVTPSTMYVGSSVGLFKSTDSGSTWTPQNNFGLSTAPNVRALAIDPNSTSTIYAGTFSNGLFKTTNAGSSWTAMNTGMGGNSPTTIFAIAIDPFDSSTIYTGHGSSGGMNKSTNGGSSWTPVTSGVPSFPVTALVADKTNAGTVYAATNGAGVIKTTNGGANWTNANNSLWKVNVLSLVAHPSNSSILYAGALAGSGSDDAFVTKLNASGSGLLFSTYLGGSSTENGYGIALDSGGNIYVAGLTASTNFPVVNAIQSAPGANENCGNAFVTKMNPAVPSIEFSTYLGGSRCDTAYSLATDSAANVYVTGQTSSIDFPTANAFQPAASDQFFGNAFVTKLTTAGSMIYSTYLGGSNGSETGYSIAADASGNAYITGMTTSSNFPTVNPIQATNGGSIGDVFVAKLNTQGSALVYSTYLGGSNIDIGRGIAVDSTGNAYVTGFTSSAEFPLVAGALRTKSALFKSVDSAAHWSNENYGLRASNINTIVVHPTQPSIIYAGAANGVFKSTNSGKNWTAVNNGLTTLPIVAMVIDPSNPSTLYVATNDLGSNTNGVYKTTDGGNNWNLRRTGIVNTQVLTLAIDRVVPSTLYVGTYGGPIYKTVNGADSWAPTGDVSISFANSIAIDPQNHTTLYAAEMFSNGGFWKSVDSGATWQRIGFSQTGADATFITVSPVNPNLLYGGILSKGLLKSVDGGTNWSVVLPANGKVVLDPVNAATFYLLSFNSGVLKSTDGGQTFDEMNTGLPSPVAIALAIDPLKNSTLYLASTPAGGEDAFVTKINPSGTALIYSTFLGGNVMSINDSQSLNDDGFAIAIDSTGNAYVTGLVRSADFPTTPNAYQPFNRGGSDAFITKLGMSYLISGHVFDGAGAPLNGADVVLTDGPSLTAISTESDGSYEFSRLREGGSFTVTASKPHFTMTPASQSFNNLNSDQVLNFTATTTSTPFFTISGQVTDNGTPLAGVTITLSGSQPGIKTTDSNGNYSFELISGGNYTVTPAFLGFTFGPTSQTFNNLGASQTANFAANRQDFVVTNTNNQGAGSLREAMTNANATPGADRIVFNIAGAGVKTINLLTKLPDINDQLEIDGTTQPGYVSSPLIELDGTLANSDIGLFIKARGTTVRGLALGHFNGFAIIVGNVDNTVIQGNYIGVDATGTAERANGTGISVVTAANNLIGGTTPAARNVISGNRFNGIEVFGSHNVIQGNYIGTNAAGTAAIPNGSNGISLLDFFVENLIGGATPGAGNLISGNQIGISVNAPSTTIQGNLIGTDVTGTQKIGNQLGIRAGATDILIGGLTTAARNIISGNLSGGVEFGGIGSKLQGNYIGTDITGMLPLGNGSTGVVAGSNALVGGTVPEARNIIAANGGFGNVSLGSNSSGSAAIVQGNYIGTDVTGTRTFEGSFAGISIAGDNNIIGGPDGAGNVISGHQIGIQVGGFTSNFPAGNLIQGNLIGLNALGNAPLPNTFQGIILNGATNNTVGGVAPGTGNTIAFNGAQGVFVTSGANNSIRGNSIFSNGGLGIDLGTAGVTANDATDVDTGANNLQNFPLLTSVMALGNSTTIQGSLKSIPNTTFHIDFYTSSALDPSGNGEGSQFFNTTDINTDADGNGTINVTFAQSLPSGRMLTATATDLAKNTSEFSSGDATGAAGNVQFSVSAMWVIEDLGLATITVLRNGGVQGALSVQYATANGTATAGQDYTSTSGTLNFASGEASKTFQIPILDDATTEPDETFTVTLSNATTVDALGVPSVLTVNIQDHNTIPFLTLTGAAVVEGNAGTTTDAAFTLTLSAATGRTVSVNYATSNSGAFGGATCGTQGTDYESKSGTAVFQPGNTSFAIPVKICGDTSAEANETFVVFLSSQGNANLQNSQALGTIINDDVLTLVLEESGPVGNQAAALEDLFLLRDPFRVVSIPDWFPTGPDKNTRVIFFARNLELNPGEAPSAVIVRFVAGIGQFDVPAEDVRGVPNTDLTQVVIRLPNNLPLGTLTLTIRAHGRVSNVGSIHITQ